jgi:hypothetical protein
MTTLLGILSIVIVVLLLVWARERYSIKVNDETNESDNYDELCRQVRANSFFDSARLDEDFYEIVRDCD